MKKIVFTLILPLLSYAQAYDQPIIDMHLHDYVEQTYYVAPAPDGVFSPKDYKTYKKELFKALKAHNIKKAVVSTIGGDNILDDNGIFIPGYYTNSPPTDTVAFKALITSGKLKFFGEIGAVYDGYTLSNPEFEPYLNICERYNIPVAIHTGGGPMDITYRCCPNFRIKLGDPYTLEDVLAKHPKLKIYMMHAGEVFYENALRLMLQYSHLYTDLGVILWVDEQPKDYAEQFLRKAKKYGLIDRVMYGSDQMVWPHAIKKSIDQLNSYDFLTESDKRKIFYDNAVRFLHLEE
ncbi:amidohydrolase family protein [Flagellimonas profundi]|uniref:Amidohydrolase family protein n=1 Tax=Flagellimonas profundi TaxID=2915620 RepID=A0ABS3FED4_9FLAO|nr:amidohydrolase family protein [Allomuricauda profundi]MBO0341341.1 amidohydrolase family protein [Allomuricauda profundi]